MDPICRKSGKFNHLDLFINRDPSIPSFLCTKPLTGYGCHCILRFNRCCSVRKFYQYFKGVKFVCLHFYDRIIQVQQMLSAEPCL